MLQPVSDRAEGGRHRGDGCGGCFVIRPSLSGGGTLSPQERETGPPCSSLLPRLAVVESAGSQCRASSFLLFPGRGEYSLWPSVVSKPSCRAGESLGGKKSARGSAQREQAAKRGGEGLSRSSASPFHASRACSQCLQRSLDCGIFVYFRGVVGFENFSKNDRKISRFLLPGGVFRCFVLAVQRRPEREA